MKGRRWMRWEVDQLLEVLRGEDGFIDTDRRCRPGEGEALARHLGRSPCAIATRLHEIRRDLRAGGLLEL